MATSKVPAIIDALVTQLTTALPNANVYDGYADDNNIGDSLMIGVDDPDSTAAAFSAEAKQEMATGGTPRSRDQDGTITCAAVCWDGDSVQKTARDAAYALQAAVENLLRNDPTLGIAQPGRLTVQMGDAERLTQNRYDEGVDALLVFNLQFTARI